jgi:hypothetical protein
VAIGVTVSAAGCTYTSYAHRAGLLVPRPVVSQDHSTKDRIRVLVFGDSGRATSVQRTVAEGMRAVCAAQACDFGLALGDNVYSRGAAAADDPKFSEVFHRAYDPLTLDIWLVPGNHDWYNDRARSLQPAIDHTVHPSNTGGTWKLPAGYYEVPRLPAWLHIFGLDTSVAYDRVARPGGHHAELTRLWREQEAAARRALCEQPGWRLLAGHHFVTSNGSEHGEDSGVLGPLIEPIIADCEVDILLSGHDHHQEVIRGLITEPEGGQHEYFQVIQGAASEVRPVRRVGGRQVMAESVPGFALLDVTPGSLTMTFHLCREANRPCEPHPARIELMR